MAGIYETYIKPGTEFMVSGHHAVITNRYFKLSCTGQHLWKHAKGHEGHVPKKFLEKGAFHTSDGKGLESCGVTDVWQYMR